jgi:hypothetical protein
MSSDNNRIRPLPIPNLVAELITDISHRSEFAPRKLTDPHRGTAHCKPERW